MIVGDYMKNRLQSLLYGRKTLYLILGLVIGALLIYLIIKPKLK